jgi:hypothetical protein
LCTHENEIIFALHKKRAANDFFMIHQIKKADPETSRAETGRGRAKSRAAVKRRSEINIEHNRKTTAS